MYCCLGFVAFLRFFTFFFFVFFFSFFFFFFLFFFSPPTVITFVTGAIFPLRARDFGIGLYADQRRVHPATHDRHHQRIVHHG